MSALAAREDSRPRARARPVAVTAACVAAAILVAGCASTGASNSASTGVSNSASTAAPVDPSLAPPDAASGAPLARPEPALEAHLLAEAGRAFAALDRAIRREAIAMARSAADSGARDLAEALSTVSDALDAGTIDAEACARRFAERFALVGADGLATGYATPRVAARRARDDAHPFPILGDLRATDPALAALPRRALLADPRAAAHAIAWIADPLDWALVETNGTAELVVEGGGEVGVEVGAEAGVEDEVEDEELLRISRLATNGRAFTSLGRALANRGALATPFDLDDVRDLAARDAGLARDAAFDNERVVFFEEVGAGEGGVAFPPALGVRGRLIPRVSCAADQRVHPAGSLLVVAPIGDAAGGDAGPTAAIAFVHDAGGAIRGAGRVDRYFGMGDAALAEAGRMRLEVRVLRLVPRSEGRP